MLVLWIGLPAISILLHILLPQTREMPFSLLFASVISSIGGTLSSVMLAVYIIHEKSQNVFELFLVRPVKRNEILNAKFLAIFFCVFVSIIISLLIGLGIDYFMHGSEMISRYIDITLESFLLSVTTIAISCSLGILVGVISSTVLVGVLLIIFVTGNISSFVLMIPSMLHMTNSAWVSFFAGIILTVLFQYLAILRFKRLQF
jgi:ABC-type transport system involved in multi-copper enzyme maturation permease subunit